MRVIDSQTLVGEGGINVADRAPWYLEITRKLDFLSPTLAFLANNCESVMPDTPPPRLKDKRLPDSLVFLLVFPDE